MRKSMLFLTLFLAVAAILAMSPLTAMAKVEGMCSECHTMHSSQTPPPADWLANGWVPGQEPNVALLAADVTTNACLGCHQAAGTVQNDGSNNIPYVHQVDNPNYGAFGVSGDTLAGGTFYHVANSGAEDVKGHNVVGVTGQDSVLNSYTPPGYDNVEGGSLGLPSGTSWSNQLTCAGDHGCHGDHREADQFAAISGGHHGDDSTIDGSTVAQSYRFLLGSWGKEWNTDGTTGGKWEYKPTSSNHNQYKALARTAETYVGAEDTISYLCAQCHGYFHSADNAVDTAQGGITNGTFGNWVRHPTDFDMADTDAGSEYKAYGPTYSVVAPVGSENVGTVLSTVNVDAGGQAIVTCISCHRAHGTNYADLLRWDYSAMEAGQGGTTGCFECHTTK